MDYKEQLKAVFDVLGLNFDLDLLTSDQCVAVLEVIKSQAIDATLRFTG
jgi:hypothetical protein